MRKISLALTVYLVINLAAIANEVGTISGRVITSGGIPIKGATVSLPDCIKQLSQGKAITDADGLFSLKLKKYGGSWDHRLPSPLFIEAEGYGANYVDGRHLILFPGLDKNLGDIRLYKGRIFSGRVVNADGKPISDAKVVYRVCRHIGGETTDGIGGEQHILTDADGRFITKMMSTGSRRAYVQKDGYQVGLCYPISFQATGPDGVLPDIQLHADKPIHGIVTDEDGLPIANANVLAMGSFVKTDSQGRFVLRGYAADASFPLRISAEGYAHIRWSVTATPEGFKYYDNQAIPRLTDTDIEAYEKVIEAATVRVAKLEVRLKREARIRGRVVDAETGKPVMISRIVRCTFTRKKNGEIVLDGCHNSRFSQDKPGEFTLNYSFPTEYHLTVSAKGYDDAEAFTSAVTTL